MNRLIKPLFYLLLFLLPTQLGKHFWLSESLVMGRRIDFLSPTVFVADIIIFLIAVLLINKYKPKLKSFFKPLLIISIISGFLLISSEVKILTFFLLLRWWWLFVFGLIIYQLRPSKTEMMLPISGGVILTGILAASQFLAQRSIGGIFYWLGERTFNPTTLGIAQFQTASQLLLRPYAAFPHPNVMAGFTVVLLPFYLFNLQINGHHLYSQKRLFANWINFTALLFINLTIFLSFSRVAWFVAAMIWLTYFLKKINRLVSRKTILIAILLLAFIIWEETIIGRFGSLFSADSQSYQDRLVLINAASKIVITHPIVGVGLGGFIPALPKFITSSYLLQPVHSIYLLIFCETGIIGIVTIFYYSRKVFIRAYQNRKWDGLVALVAILLLGLVDHYFISLPQTRIVLVLIIAYIFIDKTKTPKIVEAKKLSY